MIRSSEKPPGRLLLDGKPYQPKGPKDAERHGIAFIHQELNLFRNLNIAENLFIAGFPKLVAGLPFIDHRAADAIERHALADTSVELGGILLGKECVDEATAAPFVWVTQSR